MPGPRHLSQPCASWSAVKGFVRLARRHRHHKGETVFVDTVVNSMARPPPLAMIAP
jgi:hypothetical protein